MKLNTRICRIHTVEGGRVRRRGLLVASLAMVMLLAACGSNGPGSAPGPEPTTGTTSTQTPPSPGGDAGGAATGLDAYRGMWQAYQEAIAIPDPDYPELARYAQGDALRVLISGVTSVRDQGLVGVGEAVLNPRVVAELFALTPPQVKIDDCMDTSQTHLVKRDGSPYEDRPGGRRSVEATAVQLDDGTWKVAEFVLHEVGTC
jgi:predicted small lipoprotein YifL